MSWLALDIGGANLKAADGLGFCLSRRFALWKKPEQLAAALRELIAQAPSCDHVAATMTGELADCFATKTDGVRHIVQALSEAASGRHTRIYLLNGTLVAPPVALHQPLLAAASNWHILARFAGRFAPQGSALLLDLGSTTCDLIPLVDGQPAAAAQADTERLLSGELVYSGVERSPACAVAPLFPWRGQWCPTVQELFATTWDAYLLMGELPEEPASHHTADGRPATKAAARDRLARMICADRETFSDEDAAAAASTIANCQLDLLATAAKKVVERMADPPHTVIVSGQGEFLCRRLAARVAPASAIVSLQQKLGPNLSRCAPAHALAVIARGGK
ncbi:MAG TPA: hydantoinase/oxoprolinase family protein [Pirellulales bacterium]|jgi:hypothetical protein|nr:hydantoinase/oxoprolinase family protein [Pirellulales bacterium]